MQYEICFIVLKEEQKKIVLKILKDCNAKILFEQDIIGRRKFAYPIKKENAGYYFSIYFDLENNKISNLNKALQAEQELLRLLIVKNDIDIKKLIEIKTAKSPKIEKKVPQEKPKVSKLIKRETEMKEFEPEKKKEETAKTKKIQRLTKKIIKAKPITVKKEEIIVKKKESISEDEALRIKKLEEKLDELLKE